MVQLQILSKILNTKGVEIVVDNNLTAEYFGEYKDEYMYIMEHYNEYKNVPDAKTFQSVFTDFDILEVTESDRYLVNTIREEYLYAKSVPVIKKAAELLKGDANEFSRYLQSELVNLTPNYTTHSVDLAHIPERIGIVEDKNSNKDQWFISSGFEELDDIIGGFQRGEEYVVLFARTGQGKSWVLVKLLEHSWALGFNVGYISPEMSATKLGYRFDTVHAHFSNTALTRGDTNNLDIKEYKEYFDELSTHKNKFLVSTPRDFNNEITVNKLRTFCVQNKLDVLGVDGISYLKDARYKRSDNLSTTLKNISEDLMLLSCELNIPILIVVQSNRGGVDKDTPDIEDIRDSDGISFNATKIISLKQKENQLIMQVKKNRDGKVGDKLTYNWDIDLGEFSFVAAPDDDVPQQEKRERKVDAKKKAHEDKRKVAF